MFKKILATIILLIIVIVLVVAYKDAQKCDAGEGGLVCKILHFLF